MHFKIIMVSNTLKSIKSYSFSLFWQKIFDSATKKSTLRRKSVYFRLRFYIVWFSFDCWSYFSRQVSNFINIAGLNRKTPQFQYNRWHCATTHAATTSRREAWQGSQNLHAWNMLRLNVCSRVPSLWGDDFRWNTKPFTSLQYRQRCIQLQIAYNFSHRVLRKCDVFFLRSQHCSNHLIQRSANFATERAKFYLKKKW